MDTKRAEALRSKRQQRLASSEPETNSPAAAPPAPVAPPRELVAKVADPGQIPEDARVTLTGPFGSGTTNPHWVVMVNGDPLAKIALADQEKPEEIQKLFATNDYAEGFTSALKKIPLMQLLASVKARPYVAAVKGTEVFAALSDQVKGEATLAFQKKTAQFRDDLLTMINLVVEGQRKNFLPQNTLKDSLFTQMRKAGIKDPVPMIEAAFSEASPSHFEFIVKQAMRWLDFSPEALADIKQTIMEMPVREVTAATPANNPNMPLVPSEKANVPLVASQPQERRAEPDELEAARNTFKFRSRMHDRKLSPNG